MLYPTRTSTSRPLLLKARGFTIVELLIVIVIIAILAVITVVAYNGVQARATAALLSSDLVNASKTIKLFQVDTGTAPATIDCGQADSQTNKCLRPSTGVSYQYKVSATNPSLYCLSATKADTSYATGTDSPILGGPCPVLWLDAANPSSYPGSGTAWKDLSGNDTTSTLGGGVSYSSANGGVLGFDGVDDYVALSNDLITTQNIRANGATYAAWVKPTDFAQESRIVGQKPVSGYGDFALGRNRHYYCQNSKNDSI